MVLASGCGRIIPYRHHLMQFCFVGVHVNIVKRSGPPLDPTEPNSEALVSGYFTPDTEDMANTKPTLNTMSPETKSPAVKYNYAREKNKQVEVGETSTRNLCTRHVQTTGNTTVDVDKVLPGLCALRSGIIPLVQAEQMKLQEARHLAYATVSKKKNILRTEKERSRTLTRKISEKREQYEQAMGKYEHSRTVLVVAMGECGSGNGVEEKRSNNIILRNCEALVNSWYDQVQASRNRVAEWEFKKERHGVMLARIRAQLHEAEIAYRTTCETLDADHAHLRAVLDVLGSVKD